MTIDKTIKSKYQPKQTNVTWVDLSGETPVEKHFINGRWRPIGGGGSTNPGYSSTKQTVTLFNDTIEMLEQQGIYTGVVQNPDFDLVAGETYTVVFDGTSYDIEAVEFSYNNAVVLGEMGQSGPSFETYPFIVMEQTSPETGEVILMFGTPTEGPHTFVIKQEETVMTTTPEFKSAVDSVTGYSIDTKETVLFDDTVVVSEPTELIPGFPLVKDNEYKVTFNGTEYTCKCFQLDDVLAIGASPGVDVMTFDWSNYPFVIGYDDSLDVATDFMVQTPGTYTLKVETLVTSTKTTLAFESMIQGIAGSGSGSDSNNIIVYPNNVSFVDVTYSTYNNPPEQGKIYFIPFGDTGSPYGQYLYPVHIDELTNNNNRFSGFATIIGNPIIIDSGTLTAQPFNHTINPDNNTTKGLCITYDRDNNNYRLHYGFGEVG